MAVPRTRTGRTALPVLVALAATIGAMGASPAGAVPGACTKTWTATTSGQWTDGSKWSGGSAPTASDHVCIVSTGSTYTVSLTGSATIVVASLTLGTTSAPTAQILALGQANAPVTTSLTATQGIVIAARGVMDGRMAEGGELTVAVGTGETISNAGTITTETPNHTTNPGPTLRGDVLNSGTFSNTGPVVVEGDFTTDGDFNPFGSVTVTDTAWTRAGESSGGAGITTPGTLRVGDMDTSVGSLSALVATDGADISIEGDGAGTIIARGAVALTGAVAPDQRLVVRALDGEPATLRFSGALTNQGEIEVHPHGDVGATLTGSAPGDDLVNEGLLGRAEVDHGEGPAEIVAEVVNRGTVDTADGTFRIDGSVRSEALIALHQGTLRVDDDLVLTPLSVVEHGVRSGVGADAGRIQVGDAVTVDGALETTTLYDQDPVVGSVINVIDAASRTGTFDELRFAGHASYDAQYTALRANLVRRASESDTRRFVRAAHQDFLGRQPTATELAQRAAALDGGALTRTSLVRQLSLSPEYVTTLVQRFYADTLGRPGDPGGVAFWVGELRGGRKTVAQVAGSFYASAEYFGRAGGTDAAWVGDLYDVFFDRPPSEIDLGYWLPRIEQRGRTRVATELFQSFESRRQRVQRLYQDLLGRAGDPDGVTYWAARLTNEGDLGLAVFLASSSEYLQRAELRYP